MPIFLEASEARADSRMPKSVIQAAHIVIGLERLTSADILISPLEKPRLPDTLKNIKPHTKMLLKHTKVGILAQRKHGLDMISSIGELDRIETKMQDWCGKFPPELWVVGKFEQGRYGLLVSGQDISTSHSYLSVTAAKYWWNQRGGTVVELHSANRIPAWVNYVHQQVFHKVDAQPEHIVLNLPPAQVLKGEQHWWTSLAAVPGIGVTRAQAIAQWLPPEWQSMAHALYCLSNIEHLTLPGRPKGVGVKTVQAMRDWLGIEDDEIVIVRKREGDL